MAVALVEEHLHLLPLLLLVLKVVMVIIPLAAAVVVDQGLTHHPIHPGRERVVMVDLVS